MIIEPVMLMCSEWIGVWVYANDRKVMIQCDVAVSSF